MQQNISNLATALAKAQSEFPEIRKNRTARMGTYSYQYADLTEIIEAVKKVLANNGLSFSQAYVILDDGRQALETRLMHTSGEVQFGRVLLPDPTKLKAQEFGSWTTYFRRYALTAMLGVNAEEDDDGAIAQVPNQQQNTRNSHNSANSTASSSNNVAKPAFQQKTPNGGDSNIQNKMPNRDRQVSEAQLKRLFAIQKNKNVPDDAVADMAKQLGIGSRKTMNMSQYDTLIEKIQNYETPEG